MEKHYLAAGAAPSNNTVNGKTGGGHKSKNKKSAKKVANAIGSLSSASTAAVVGTHNGSLSQH